MGRSSGPRRWPPEAMMIPKPLSVDHPESTRSPNSLLWRSYHVAGRRCLPGVSGRARWHAAARGMRDAEPPRRRPRPDRRPFATGRSSSRPGCSRGSPASASGRRPPPSPRSIVKLPPEIQASLTKRTMELKRRQGVSMDRAAALAYGGLGMFLGLALGAAGGLVRRSPVAAIAAGLIGLVLGGAAGAGTTLALLPSYHAALAARQDEDKENNLSLALMTHGGIWVAVGAAAGLALGLGLGGLGRIARATIGGILGACLAAAIYEFAGAIVFPTAETFRPMAVAPAPRLLAHLSVALCVAVGALGFADYVTFRRAKTATGSSS